MAWKKFCQIILIAKICLYNNNIIHVNQIRIFTALLMEHFCSVEETDIFMKFSVLLNGFWKR